MDFHVTGLCNLNCKFCCGTLDKTKGPNFRDIVEVLQKLKQIGVTTIVLTGGEPLLRPDIVRIIEKIYKEGFEVYLSSNGILLPRYWKKLEKFISCIGLPVDGSTAKKSAYMGRSANSFRSVLKMLRFFKHNKPKCSVKIGTIVSKRNEKDIIDIGNLIFRNPSTYSQVIWRLYEFSPLNRGKKYASEYSISDSKYFKICQAAKKNFPHQKISFLSNAQSDGSYFFIDPHLRLLYLKDDKYNIIADLKRDKVNSLINIKKSLKSAIHKGSLNRKWLPSK